MSEPVVSTMQDAQLTIGSLLQHGARVYATSVVRTFDGDGVREATYAEVAERSARLAGALAGLGMVRGTASGRSCGTRRSTWRPTSPCRPWARCCTR